MNTRYSLLAVAATSHCLDIYMSPMRKLGPIRPAQRILHPVELAVGSVLSIPLLPAAIDMNPDPLWLGLALLPARLTGDDGKPARQTMRQYMAGVSERLELRDMGDGAGALGKSVMSQIRRRHYIDMPGMPGAEGVIA